MSTCTKIARGSVAAMIAAGMTLGGAALAATPHAAYAAEAGEKAVAADKLDWTKLADGEYAVKVNGRMVTDVSKPSMMDSNSIAHDTTLTVKGGEYYLSLTFKGAIPKSGDKPESGFLTKVEKWASYTANQNPENLNPKPAIETLWSSTKPEGEVARLTVKLTADEVKNGMFALRFTTPAMGSNTPTAAIVVDTASVKLVKAAATLNRLAGANAFGTMQKIHEAGWKGETGGTVVVAAFEGYWDALAASGLAGFDKAPVVMTYGDRLSPEAEAILRAARPSKVYVMGGEAAVSEGVRGAIDAAAGVKSQRIAGDTATGTAAKAALAGKGKWAGDTAILATNDGYWDALAASPFSYARNMPIFLTEGAAKVSDETLQAMKELGIKNVLVMGGTAAISSDVEKQLEAEGIKITERFAGSTAVETALKFATLATANGLGGEAVGLATVDGYWDALTGAALCGKNGSPLVIVNDANDAQVSAVGAFLKNHRTSIDKAMVFGGDAAISEKAVKAIASVLDAKPADGVKPGKGDKPAAPGGDAAKPDKDAKKPGEDATKPGKDAKPADPADTQKPGEGTKKPDGDAKPADGVKPDKGDEPAAPADTAKKSGENDAADKADKANK
ncbi:hypothetical protein HLV38_04335 [Berryella wangjianweii]|uniref:Cell wall binding repeat 2 n=1 Tax=Berryella wangjianweii TaxID=2734634 RepID=A0A6M8J2P9_9ACTN|nr:cell wall-binding repeat-containing protein [Berryella wangjianweii]QKF07431.1 hypothetical protein HLV38_04335 [Berryella wangjianweii]